MIQFNPRALINYRNLQKAAREKIKMISCFDLIKENETILGRVSFSRRQTLWEGLRRKFASIKVDIHIDEDPRTITGRSLNPNNKTRIIKRSTDVKFELSRIYSHILLTNIDLNIARRVDHNRAITRTYKMTQIVTFAISHNAIYNVLRLRISRVSAYFTLI